MTGVGMLYTCGELGPLPVSEAMCLLPKGHEGDHKSASRQWGRGRHRAEGVAVMATSDFRAMPRHRDEAHA